MVYTANALAILSADQERYDTSIEILKKSEKWANNDQYLSKKIRIELRAHVCDAWAYFFFQRKSLNAAHSNTIKAMDLHEQYNNMEAYAVCVLHLSTIYSIEGKFKESHKWIYKFLAMVEDGRLRFEDATPKQLCLVAIGYHNLAVIQLKMQVPDLAAKSIQNARKIARLCISYSNRWLNNFQWTYDVAMEDCKIKSKI